MIILVEWRKYSKVLRPVKAEEKIKAGSKILDPCMMY